MPQLPPALLDARADRLAELVAREVPLMEAGRELGLSKGETSAAWRRVRKALGAQAV